MNRPAPVLDLRDITASYPVGFTRRRLRVLHDVGLEVRAGEILGLLGVNGAGKTTLLKVAAGVNPPDTGEARIGGRPAADPRARARVGFMPEAARFDPRLSLGETLEVVDRLVGGDRSTREDRTDELLERVGIPDLRDRRAGELSKGQGQRLGLAVALLGRPDLLVLDEPLDGLDPIGRAELKRIVREERERGAAVVFSTHILSDVEEVADRVAVLDGGRLVRRGTVAEVAPGRVRTVRILGEAADGEALARELRSEGFEPRSLGGGRLEVRLEEVDRVEACIASIGRGGGRLIGVDSETESLDAYFRRTFDRDGEDEEEAGPATEEDPPATEEDASPGGDRPGAEDGPPVEDGGGPVQAVTRRLRAVRAMAHRELLGSLRDRVILGLLVAGTLAIVCGELVSWVTRGEPSRILTNAGFAAIALFSAAIAIAAGSRAVSEDITSRTAHALLARPLARLDLVLGKLAGIGGAIAAAILGLGAILGLLLLVHGRTPGWMLGCGLLATFLEVAVVCAMALFLSSLTNPTEAILIGSCFYLTCQWASGLRDLAALPSVPAPVARVLEGIYLVVPDLGRFGEIRLRAAYPDVEHLVAGPLEMGGLVAYAAVWVGVGLVLAALAIRRRTL